jgi:hypothetical protein
MTSKRPTIISGNFSGGIFQMRRRINRRDWPTPAELRGDARFVKRMQAAIAAGAERPPAPPPSSKPFRPRRLIGLAPRSYTGSSAADCAGNVEY